MVGLKIFKKSSQNGVNAGKNLKTVLGASSVIGGFYALSYDVDYFLLAVGIAFVVALLVLKFKNKNNA
ncbi:MULTISPECIES: hypothetical protein [Acidiplasma]|jgi:hypothetical protein|uniref:Uncharacterized protein n=2 Tax=Acidiplasma TaxID=507753 RepID=A0A0Q0RI74_9ARCH